MQSTEQWLPVVGYEGYYEVSDHGRVRSIDRRVADGRTFRGRMLAHWVRDSGHHIVTLSVGGAHAQRYVHVMVLEAFVGARPDGYEGCHYDGTPANNRLANLRWDTASANAYDAVRHGQNFHAAKECCPRGHSLVEPNLVRSQALKGHRSCKACARAWSTARRLGTPLDAQVADEKYRLIMAGVN